MTIFQTLEVSAFPGSSHTLRVQITSSLVDVLHEYFVIEGKGNSHSRDSNKRENTQQHDLQRGKQQIVGSAPPPARSFWRPRSVTTGSADSANKLKGSTDGADTKSVISSHTEDSDGQYSGTTSGGGLHPLNVPPQTAASAPDSHIKRRDSERRRTEVLYVKYLRFGEVNVEVSTAGFPVNLDRYNAIVEPFVRYGKIFDWPRLISKLERHASWSLTKNTASSSLNKLQRMLFGAPKPKNSKEEEDTEAHKAALLLGAR